MVWPILKELLKVVGITTFQAWRQVSRNSKTQESIYEELKKLADKKDNPFFRKNDRVGSIGNHNISKADLQSKIDKKVLSLMSIQDAVEILQLKEASSLEIEKRFHTLQKANNWNGGSKYVYDKIKHAKIVCEDSLRNGTLNKYIKK